MDYNNRPFSQQFFTLVSMWDNSRSCRKSAVNKMSAGGERRYLMAKRIWAGSWRLGRCVLLGQFSHTIPSPGFMNREVNIQLHGWVDLGQKSVSECTYGTEDVFAVWVSRCRLFKANTWHISVSLKHDSSEDTAGKAMKDTHSNLSPPLSF